VDAAAEPDGRVGWRAKTSSCGEPDLIWTSTAGGQAWGCKPYSGDRKGPGMEGIRVDEHHHEMYARLEQEADKKWVHHAADLEREEEVRSQIYDGPVALLKRVDAVAAISPGHRFDPSVFQVFERLLTPRSPYQSSPLSYMNAMSRSWSLWAEVDRLEWAELSRPDARYGGIEFWFRNVAVGTTALVSIDVVAGAVGPGVTGSIAVRSSAAAPRSFPISGFADHTLDLIVRPTTSFAVLVTIEVGSGVGYLALRAAGYRTI
jgi:hypothetical protein